MSTILALSNSFISLSLPLSLSIILYYCSGLMILCSASAFFFLDVDAHDWRIHAQVEKQVKKKKKKLQQENRWTINNKKKDFVTKNKHLNVFIWFILSLLLFDRHNLFYQLVGWFNIYIYIIYKHCWLLVLVIICIRNAYFLHISNIQIFSINISSHTNTGATMNDT